jgi:hypothetical protein
VSDESVCDAPHEDRDSGNVRGACAKEIWDIRRVAGSKNNAAIQEMMVYAKSNGFVPLCK